MVCLESADGEDAPDEQASRRVADHLNVGQGCTCDAADAIDDPDEHVNNMRFGSCCKRLLMMTKPDKENYCLRSAVDDEDSADDD